MPATINVNDKTVVHKSSGGISTAFPDVCKTPTPAGPVPIPYPNIAKSQDTAMGSTTTTMDGNPIMLKGSIYSMSTGDEAGSVGGVVSGVIKGKAEFLNYSFDVKVEGKNVCRLSDLMGQNESSLNIGGFPTMQPPVVAKGSLKRKIISRRIKEITFKSGIKLTTDETEGPVPPSGQPHYKNETGAEVFPAVYLKQSAGGKKDLEVKLEITDLENISGSAKLSGEGGGIKVKPKDFNLDKVVITLQMEFETIPDEMVYFRQGIKWTITAQGETFPVGSTNVKLFFLHAKPVAPWVQKDRVWLLALTFLFLKIGVRGKKPQDAVALITRYCHSMHHRYYDTLRGKSNFARGSNMKLSPYLKTPKFIVNCHDQAYAVITLSAALGIPVEYIFMGTFEGSPPGVVAFGFITTTDLVGVGACNNPFYMGEWHHPHEAVTRAQIDSYKIVNPGTPPPMHKEPDGYIWPWGRSSFGNHGFCQYRGKIYDACAGPHLGTESPNEYAKNSIDVSRKYYRSHAPSAAEMSSYVSNVTSVS
ncbi:MAG: DUF4150 domain-containing protein [Gemmataceae bacterium]|nr:DUF4150 domain-containing protein [Gemmataceae bacterium]